MPYTLQILFSGLIAFVPYHADPVKNKPGDSASAYRVLLINGRNPGMTADGSSNHVSHIPSIRFKTKNYVGRNINNENFMIHPGSAFPYDPLNQEAMWVLDQDDLTITRGTPARPDPKDPGTSIAGTNGQTGNISHTTPSFDDIHKMTKIYSPSNSSYDGLSVNPACLTAANINSLTLGLVGRLRIAEGTIRTYSNTADLEYAPLDDNGNRVPYKSGDFKFIDYNNDPSNFHKSPIYACVSLEVSIPDGETVRITSNKTNNSSNKYIELSHYTGESNLVIMIENAPPLGLRNARTMPGGAVDMDYDLVYKIAYPPLTARTERIPHPWPYPYPIACGVAVYNSSNQA